MPEVQIKGGVVTLRETLTRKVQKGFNKILFKDAKANAVGGSVEINLSCLEDANDSLVLGMIEKAKINDAEMLINEKLLDNLSQEDFQKLLDKCNELKTSNEETKKK